MPSLDGSRGINPSAAEAERRFESPCDDSLDMAWAGLGPVNQPQSSSLLQNKEGFVREQLTFWKTVIKERSTSHWVLLLFSCAAMMTAFPASVFLPDFTMLMEAFTAILAYFIVGQRFNSSIVNAVAVMTSAAVILDLDSNSDCLYGVSSREYVIGFMLTIAGSAVHGLIFALSELLFIILLGRESLRVALEAQSATSFFATLFTSVGILITGDFQKVREQALTFKHGPGAYYQVFTWLAVSFQLGILGSVGCLYLASTLLANTGRVPVTAVAAVICFNDPMGGYKILAIVLTVWSFESYMWGSYHEQSRLERKESHVEHPNRNM